MSQEAIYSPSLQSVTQRLFIAEEFHHLNVPRVGTVEVWGIFDCAFKCVRNPLCFSVNLAASKAADGKLWCELLSSDKYRDPAEYKGNISAHHYHMEVKRVFSAFRLLLVAPKCFPLSLSEWHKEEKGRLRLDMQCPGFFRDYLLAS